MVDHPDLEIEVRPLCEEQGKLAAPPSFEFSLEIVKRDVVRHRPRRASPVGATTWLESGGVRAVALRLLGVAGIEFAFVQGDKIDAVDERPGRRFLGRVEGSRPTVRKTTHARTHGRCSGPANAEALNREAPSTAAAR